jgi:hypothetical protein
MKYNYALLIRAVMVLAVAVPLSACVEDIKVQGPENVEVGFYVGENQTRTSMLSNGLSAMWEADDQIALWAVNSSGVSVLSNQVFKAYGINQTKAFFTSTLSNEMPQGAYTYYCCYPIPSSVDGTSVTFDLPSSQDGRAGNGVDVMIADAVKHGPLASIPQVDDHSGMSMHMNRMMHQFRFFIPENDAVLGNDKIHKIVLDFPRDVYGSVTYNLTNPSGAAALSNSTGRIVVDLASAIGPSSETSGDYDFACVAFVPTTFADGESLQIRAYTDNKIAKVDPISLRSRTFEAGHSTPVRLVIKEVVDYPYSIRFNLASNNLGENPTSIKLMAPSGCVWPGTQSNEYVYAPGREIAAGESFEVRFEEIDDYKAFSNKDITIVFDSEHATMTEYARIGNIPSDAATHTSVISASIPYLFYQDFSSVSSYSDGHDNPKVGTASDTYKGITELSSCGLTNWYGTRIGIEGAARICCRYEHVLLAGAYYKGRMYTSPLSNIKDGKDTKISVSYRYGSNINERDPVFGSKPNKSPILYFGINTQGVVTNPDQSEGDVIDSVTGLIAGSGFANPTPSSLSPMVIREKVLAKSGGSYTSMPNTETVTIDNVDGSMRLAWIITTDNTASNTNGNYWIYIDDIKVQIAK